MVSKARTLDASSAVVRGGGRFLLTVSLVGATLIASGCPARQQQILITSGGAQWLINACNRICLSRTEEDGGGSEPPCTSCGLPGHLPPEFSQTLNSSSTPIQARLFLVTPGAKATDARIRDASKCMILPSVKGPRTLADGLNQQLDGAIANGLGFDGLQNTQDVVLFMAFYQQQDFQAPDAGEEQSLCRRVDLVACAGLAPPLGGGEYDMSCASCQDGSRNPQSRDNGPCPKYGAQCFLDACDTWLATNGYE